MTKKENLENPNSCLNHAADDEPIFVLRAKDPCAARAVEFWAAIAKGAHEDEKIQGALAEAKIMREWLRTALSAEF